MWDGTGCGRTPDGWGCSGRLSPARGLVIPDEEGPELIVIVSFLALGHRWRWGLPAQGRGEISKGVEGPP